MSGSWRRMLPQGGSERQSDLRMHLDLADSRKLVFDRVFRGDDLGLVVADLQKRTIERRRLARARRAGHQDDSVRQLDQLAEDRVLVRLHAELREAELHGPLVEQPHHDPFAVDHGDHRDADVDLAAADLQHNPAVLRKPALGDVQSGHDLQAADDCRLEAADLRRHRLRVEHAVDAVADPQPRLLRLDVYVAGPRLDGLQQDLVDQPDDRRLLRHLREFRAVRLDLLQEFHAVVVGRLGHQPLDRLAAHAQVGLDQLGDLVAAGQHGHDRLAGGQAQLVQRVEVERIAGGDHQSAVVLADGEEGLAVDELGRELLEQRKVHVRLGEVDVVQADLFAQSAQGRLLGEKTEFHGDLVQTVAFRLGLARQVELP